MGTMRGSGGVKIGGIGPGYEFSYRINKNSTIKDFLFLSQRLFGSTTSAPATK
jgi:hypothetical protein